MQNARAERTKLLFWSLYMQIYIYAYDYAYIVL